MSTLMDLFGVIVDDDSTPEQTHEASLWLGEAINLTPDSDPERFSVHCGSLRGVRRVIGSIVDDRGDVFEVTVHRPAKDGGDVAWHGIVSPGDMP
jgi:hypothetical protein